MTYYVFKGGDSSPCYNTTSYADALIMSEAISKVHGFSEIKTQDKAMAKYDKGVGDLL